AQYAIDAGDTGFAPGFQKLLRRAIAIGQRRPELKDTTLAQYRADPSLRWGRLSTASSIGCSPSALPPRPANSSPAASANAAATSSSLSLPRLFPRPPTMARVPCGPG